MQVASNKIGNARIAGRKRVQAKADSVGRAARTLAWRDEEMTRESNCALLRQVLTRQTMASVRYAGC